MGHALATTRWRDPVAARSFLATTQGEWSEFGGGLGRSTLLSHLGTAVYVAQARVYGYPLVNEVPGGGRSPLRDGLLLAAGTAAFFGSIGAAATRVERVASAWNRFSPLADPGLKLGRRKYMLHAPHRLGAPGHQGHWHWEAYFGPIPLWHRKKFRIWQRFF